MQFGKRSALAAVRISWHFVRICCFVMAFVWNSSVHYSLNRWINRIDRLSYALRLWPLAPDRFKIAKSSHFRNISQTFGAQTCHLACLVPPLWRPGRPWNDPGTRGTKKDTLIFRLGFLLILRHFGTTFWKLVGYLRRKKIYLFMLVYMLSFLINFGSESGCLWEARHFT